MRLRSLRRRVSVTSVCLVTVCIFVIFVILIGSRGRHRLIRDTGYLLRPAWDKPTTPNHTARPWIQLPQYYHPDIAVSERCTAFGWKIREPSNSFRVIDATLFSIELDMLEIRLVELWSYVDVFLIVEGNTTFTGLPKPLIFHNNRERFAWAESKIIYQQVTDLEAGESKAAREGWKNEDDTRDAVAKFLRRVVKVQDGDLVIESDVDEIPSAATMSLLRSCEGYDADLHLNLDSFMYSFEFSASPALPLYSTLAHVRTWSPDAKYTHRRTAEAKRILLRAGWHCSFCFRNLRDFQFKMAAFSHADRLLYPEQMLDPKYIQDHVCSGQELFGMLPEAYTWKELWNGMGSYPKVREGNLPKAVIQDVIAGGNKYGFLLPGRCGREDYEETKNDFDMFGPRVGYRGY
jgi:beta-1,4-mannosyl-glycoprotein beta-1,4-N-acetylglucosaminyltransferase